MVLASDASARVRLLAVGDFSSPTPSPSALVSILGRLADDFEIHQIGVAYSGDPHELPWPVYPASLGGDAFGVGRLRPLVEALKPGLVLLVNDPWVLADSMDPLRSCVPGPPVVLYCPVGGGPLPDAVVERLEGAARLIAYTEFGRAELERSAERVRRRREGFALPPIDVISHGVDVLSPEPTGVLSRNPDSFIVLNANPNLPHKRLDVTAKAFALFAAGKPAGVRLSLPFAVPGPFDLASLARRLGVADRLIAPPAGSHPPSREDLNRLYHAAAVGLNTSTAESWGLASFEHAATGAAQVMPRHSALEELWSGSAVFVEPALRLTRTGSLIEEWFVTPEAVAAALERLYRDRELLEHASQAAYRNATRPEYRWSEIGNRWRALLRQAVQEKPLKASESPAPVAPRAAFGSRDGHAADRTTGT